MIKNLFKNYLWLFFCLKKINNINENFESLQVFSII